MKKKNITVLSVGDSLDFDSYRKLNKEKRFIEKQGFCYATMSYEDLLKRRLPDISTEKVIIFFFFPFEYWNKNIEKRGYRGIYGNYTFYGKFRHFCAAILEIISKAMPGKQVLLIDDPGLSSLYRDKVLVVKTLSGAGTPVPATRKVRRIREINRMLEKGHRFYIKPCCGSMGKGITYLQLGDWQTNFEIRNDKIISRRSDYGWHFHNVTGNTTFLRDLFRRKSVFMEEAVDTLKIGGDKVDFRVYTFFDKALYVYPRRNNIDAVTTNISQGGRGDIRLLKVMPDKAMSRIKKAAVKAARALDLNFAGVDVIIDNKLKDIYVVDVNMFPGFPKRRTFNLARSTVTELKKLDKKGLLRYEKGSDIQL